MTVSHTKYKHSDNVNLQKELAVTIRAVLEKMFGPNVTTKVNSSSITHADLQPEGDSFSISFQVEMHRKDQPTDE